MAPILRALPLLWTLEGPRNIWALASRSYSLVFSALWSNLQGAMAKVVASLVMPASVQPDPFTQEAAQSVRHRRPRLPVRL